MTPLALAIVALAAGATDAPELLRTHCLGCHAGHAQAPIRFDTLEGVQRNRGLMRALIEDRTMPPWLPSDEGAPLTHRRRLDDATREALLAALATRESADRAFASLAPPLPPEIDCPDIFGPRAAWTMPATGGMRLRTYLADVAASAPTRVRGARFAEPRDLGLSPLRFVSLAPDPKRTLSAMEVGGVAGFESMGNVGRVPSGALGALSRVATAFELPRGFAFDLPRGGVAIETLGEPVGRERPVDPTLAWIAADTADTRTVHPLAFFPSRLVLEPGEISERTVEQPMPRAMDVVGVIAKGGAFLRSVRLEATAADGATSVLLDVPDFRVSLLEPWILREPVRIEPGARLAMRLGYDNSAANPQQPSRPPQRVVGGLPPDHEDTLCVVLYAEVMDPAPRRAPAQVPAPAPAQAAPAPR